MNRTVNITVTAALPADLFQAARAVLGAEAAFDQLKAALSQLGIGAVVVWGGQDEAAPVQHNRRPTTARGWRTESRAAFIEANYPSEMGMAQLVDGVNALPGGIVSKSAIISFAHSRGLRRPVITPGQIQAVRARSSIGRRNGAAHV